MIASQDHVEGLFEVRGYLKQIQCTAFFLLTRFLRDEHLVSGSATKLRKATLLLCLISIANLPRYLPAPA